MPLSDRNRKYTGFTDLKMMHNLLNKKKHVTNIAVWWIVAVFWLTFCFYLSWQTGEETVGLSLRITQCIYNFLSGWGFTAELKSLHMQLRLFAHFGVFFVTGVLLACAITATFQRSNRIVLFSVSSVLCTIIAVLSEVGKLNVPGRHLTWSEAGINVLGALCGVGLMYGSQAFKKHARCLL